MPKSSSRAASTAVAASASTSSRQPVVNVDQERLLVATAQSGHPWKSPQEFVLSLAMQVPEEVYYFVQVYAFPPFQDRQRFLLSCAASSLQAARPHIGDSYDVATYLLTRVERAKWKAADIVYLSGARQLEAARTALRSQQPYDASEVKLPDVKKEIARQKRGKAKAREALEKKDPKAQSNKRKWTAEDVRRVANAARDASKKYIITEKDKADLARYLADGPKDVAWKDMLSAFVEHRKGAGRHSFSTWSRMLEQEHAFFETQVEELQRTAKRRRIDPGNSKERL
ncbi:hypothetical protein FRB90_003670 [Tulasnella sp. 427]|nr:hypothetical protein FRB90_003670 [Tulasnella sp. 427]